MKKTLIALAVAASAAVSGSAMAAWTANGTGGSVDLGGTLTPVEKVTPWEVKVGNAVTGLDALVQKGQKTVEVKTSSAIPVLGIRTQSSDAFTGQSGISPQISYDGAVDVNGFNAGVTTVSMEVRDEQGSVIGGLVAPFFAAAGASRASDSIAFSAYVYDGYSVSSFKGGLGASPDQVVSDLATAISRVNALDSEITANFTQQNAASGNTWRSSSFDDSSDKYSGFYGSGIESGKTITITLDQAVSGDDAIQWNASLPVTVTYA